MIFSRCFSSNLIALGCHHCISAITYDKKEYIYDSSRIFNYITCDDKINYNIPCSLIKQDWKKNINEDITYCTTNCKYNLECNIDENRKNVCYTFNTDIFIFMLIYHLKLFILFRHFIIHFFFQTSKKQGSTPHDFL